MSKITILIFILNSFIVFGQKDLKTKIIEFSPALRFGFQHPVHIGNNFFSKDVKGGFGFHSNISLVKIYNFRLGFGYEFQRLKVENSNAIGNFDFINANTYHYILEYEFRINTKLEVNPTLSYGQSQFNYKESIGATALAKQSLEEIRTGAYLNYSLNKTFLGYVGLHFSHFFNADIVASPERQDYFGKGNKFIISMGILIR